MPRARAPCAWGVAPAEPASTRTVQTGTRNLSGSAKSNRCHEALGVARVGWVLTDRRDTAQGSDHAGYCVGGKEHRSSHGWRMPTSLRRPQVQYAAAHGNLKAGIFDASHRRGPGPDGASSWYTVAVPAVGRSSSPSSKLPVPLRPVIGPWFGMSPDYQQSGGPRRRELEQPDAKLERPTHSPNGQRAGLKQVAFPGPAADRPRAPSPPRPLGSVVRLSFAGGPAFCPSFASSCSPPRRRLWPTPVLPDRRSGPSLAIY